MGMKTDHMQQSLKSPSISLKVNWTPVGGHCGLPKPVSVS